MHLLDSTHCSFFGCLWRQEARKGRSAAGRAAEPRIRPQAGPLRQLILWNRKNAVQKGMRQHLPRTDPGDDPSPNIALAQEEVPMTVRDAAAYLGVSVQTVYLWVERRQIPHLRVMGRNIRFLKSDLEPFRATFKQEVGNAKT